MNGILAFAVTGIPAKTGHIPIYTGFPRQVKGESGKSVFSRAYPAAMPIQSPLEISLRLKAARWLAGTSRVRAGVKSGKAEAIALPLPELAQRSPLPENRITRNKLVEIEEMKTHVTPSQVALISEALGIDLEALPLAGDASRPASERPLPSPPGEIGHSATTGQPNDEDQQQSENPEEPGAEQGGAG